MTLDAQIEAILFFKGEALTWKRLSDILGKSEEGIQVAATQLEERLKNSAAGITLVRKEDEIMLGTHPDFSKLIETLTREELTRDLGKAGIETLSLVLYRGPLTRREIDHIRGVNSTFILRNLLIRGLVEKIPSPKDQRSFLYKPTMELLTFMGLTKIEDLPEYIEVRKEVETFETVSKEEPHEEKL